MLSFYGTQARIEALRAHLKRPGKRGDQQALMRLVSLRQELENCRVSSMKTAAFDLMLQELYPDDAVTNLALAPNPFLRFIAKEECPPDRIYVVAIGSGFDKDEP